MKKKSTVTPKSDAEFSVYREHYKKTPKYACTWNMLMGLKCMDCRRDYRMCISPYAFHRGSDEVLVKCRCQSGFLWVHLTDTRRENERKVSR